jgi:hypothetical protein
LEETKSNKLTEEELQRLGLFERWYRKILVILL